VVASGKEPVNVAELLQGTGAFGADEVRKLEEALVYGQCAELRMAANALDSEISGGEKGKAKLIRAGIAMFLLGDHSKAEPILAKLSGDGLADFYHGQVLLALGRNTEAAKAFEQSSKHGYDAVQCLLHRAGACVPSDKPNRPTNCSNRPPHPAVARERNIAIRWAASWPTREIRTARSNISSGPST